MSKDITSVLFSPKLCNLLFLSMSRYQTIERLSTRQMSSALEVSRHREAKETEGLIGVNEGDMTSGGIMEFCIGFWPPERILVDNKIQMEPVD